MDPYLEEMLTVPCGPDDGILLYFVLMVRILILSKNWEMRALCLQYDLLAPLMGSWQPCQ